MIHSLKLNNNFFCNFYLPKNCLETETAYKRKKKACKNKLTTVCLEVIFFILFVITSPCKWSSIPILPIITFTRTCSTYAVFQATAAVFYTVHFASTLRKFLDVVQSNFLKIPTPRPHYVCHDFRISNILCH